MSSARSFLSFFFFNDTATTEIYTLSLHDALPISTRDSSELIAVTSRHACVRIPRTPAPRPRAGVVAATRIGDGLVVVTSRHALGALGPQFRSTTAPLQQLDALERTHEFLGALARWTRRPA